MVSCYTSGKTFRQEEFHLNYLRVWDAKKWPIIGTYNPSEGVICPHLNVMRKCIDGFLPKYENFVIMEDFNSQPDDNVLKEFLDLLDFKNLVKEPSCNKNPHNPRLIHLIITNRPKMFQNTINVETGLSVFHMTTVTVLKTSYKKCKPNIISYRGYKHFSNESFRCGLMPLLCNERLSNKMSNDNFIEIVDNILLRHLPLRYKYVRANDCPFMNKELRKAAMFKMTVPL